METYRAWSSPPPSFLKPHEDHDGPLERCYWSGDLVSVVPVLNGCVPVDEVPGLHGCIHTVITGVPQSVDHRLVASTYLDHVRMQNLGPLLRVRTSGAAPEDILLSEA